MDEAFHGVDTAQKVVLLGSQKPAPQTHLTKSAPHNSTLAKKSTRSPAARIKNVHTNRHFQTKLSNGND